MRRREWAAWGMAWMLVVGAAPAAAQLAAPGTAAAPSVQQQAPVDEAAAEWLMQHSGLWEQLGSTGAGARAGIEAAARMAERRMPQADLDRLLAATDAAFAPATLRQAVRRALVARLPGVHLAPLRAWYDSELGRRVTAMEVAATAPGRDSDAMLRAGIRRLADLPEARRRLVEQMVQASRGAEAMTQMAVSVAVAVQRGASQARPDLPAPPVAELRAAMSAQRAQLLQMYGAMLQAMFAELYAPLADEPLQQYLAFLRSEAGAAFTEATLAAVEEALVQAAERLGERVPGARPAAST